jgi:hypothetical protein
LQLLNFSTDGGGLANWWNVMTRLIEPEEYEIDGVIFAVIPGDLWRKFSVADHQNQTQPMFARTASWDPESFPSTLEEARPHLRPMTSSGFIVSSDEFDQALELNWSPRKKKPIRPYFAWKLWQALRYGGKSTSRSALPSEIYSTFEPGQQWMINDIARVLGTMDVPTMVIHIPSREELLEGDRAGEPPWDVTRFAEMLNATFVDGRLAFAKYDGDDIRAMWLPYDAHWDQPGSDRFAEYMVDVFSKWP